MKAIVMELFGYLEEGLITDLEMLRKLIDIAAAAYDKANVCHICGTANTEGNFDETYVGLTCPGCHADKRVFAIVNGNGYVPHVRLAYSWEVRHLGFTPAQVDEILAIATGEVWQYTDLSGEVTVIRTK